MGWGEGGDCSEGGGRQKKPDRSDVLLDSE